MSDIESYFNKTTQSIDERLTKANQPVIIKDENGQDVHATDNNGQDLYYSINYDNFSFKGQQPDGYGAVVMINFKKPGESYAGQMSFLSENVNVFRVANKHKDYVKPFCSVSISKPSPLLVHFLQGVESKLFEEFDKIKLTFDKVKVKEGLEHKSAIYNKEGSSDYSVSGIKFPEQRSSDQNAILKCYCKEGCSLWKDLGRACGMPFNYIATEKNKAIFDLKDYTLLDTEAKMRFKLEVIKMTTEQRDTYKKEFEKIKTQLSENYDRLLKLKYEKYERRMEYIDIFESPEEIEKQEKEYLEVKKAKELMEKNQYCVGTINDVLIENNTNIKTMKWKISCGYWAKTNNGIKLNLSTDFIRYEKKKGNDTDLDKEFE